MTSSKPSRIGALLGTGLVACIVVSPVGAQARPPEDNLPHDWDLTVALGERSTSNVDFRSDNPGPGVDGPEGDYATDLNAAFSNIQQTERASWSFRYRPSFSRYRSKENADQNRSNHNLDFESRFSLSRRTRLSLSERFLYATDPVRTVDPGNGDLFILTSTLHWRNSVDAGMGLDLSRSVALEAGIHADVDRFEDPFRVDSNAYSGRVGALKHLGRVDNLSAAYTHSRFTFGDEGSPNVLSHGIDLTWAHGADGHPGFRISLIPTVVLRGDEQARGLTGGASLNLPIRPVNLNFGYRRAITTDTGVSNVSLAQNVFLGLSGRVGRHLSLGVSGDYGTRKSAQVGGPLFDLRYWGAGLRGDLSLTPWWSLTGDARHTQQSDSTGPGGDVTVNYFFLGMGFKVF